MLLVWILVLIVSLFFLVKSSDFFVITAEKIGKYFRMNPVIIGIIILAFGTSLPELITSLVSISRNSSEIIAGNVIGSNVANLFLVLSIICFFSKKITSQKLNNWMLGISTLFLIFISLDGKIVFYEAFIGLLIFAFYLYKLKSLNLVLNIEDKVKLEKREKLGWKDILVFLTSTTILYFSADYLVQSVINISLILNIGKEIIAATVVAFGTSVPELMVSISAIKKKKISMALGNILGSNIFNAFLIIGVAGLFGNIIVPDNMLFLGIPFLIFATLSYFLISKIKKLSSIEGIIILALYFLFIVLLVFQNIIF